MAARHGYAPPMSRRSPHLIVAVAVVGAALALAAPAGAATNFIFSLAGTSVPGFAGDGSAAVDAQLSFPAGVAVAADGAIVVADQNNQRIRRIDPSGVITTIAGTGTYGFAGDGGPATSANFKAPSSVAIAQNGDIYVADQSNNRVRRFAPGGTITTVAGDGTAAYGGDGGPATAAQLNNPIGVALGPDGSLFIGDLGNNRVRRVSPAGTITTVAGTGVRSSTGDGGPATAATLDNPNGLAVRTDGSVLVADQGGHRVRSFTPGGTIKGFAGTGVAGTGGDGGPATAALLDTPASLALAADGSVLIGDALADRVRRVSKAGVITTVAGGGPGLGDGGPATSARLFAPYGLAVTGDGGFVIGDAAQHRVRYVDAGLVGISGPVGPTGSAGAPGPAGPAGRPGVDRTALAVATSATRYSARAGRALRVRYAATAGAKATLSVRRGRKVLRTVKGTAKPGANVITLRDLPRRGSYTLVLTLAGSGRSTATARAALVVSG